MSSYLNGYKYEWLNYCFAVWAVGILGSLVNCSMCSLGRGAEQLCGQLYGAGTGKRMGNGGGVFKV